MKNKGIIVALMCMCTISLNAQVWNQVSVPTTENLNTIDFPSNQVGYIGGDNGVLLKTVDGGETWDEVEYTGVGAVTYNIEDLQFINENIGFMVLDFNGSYKTTDGGLTWVEDTDMELGNFCYRNTVHALDEDHLFLGGAGCFQSTIIKEFNSGMWSEKTIDHEMFDPSYFVNDLDFRSNLGLASTSGVFILRSTDLGQTWDTIRTPISQSLTSVLIVDDLVAYAGYEDGAGQFGILKSVDAGLTWEQDFGSATFFYPSWLSLGKSANGNVYTGALSSDGVTAIMFEYGTEWSYETVGHVIHSISSYDEDVVFGVGENGYVIVNKDLSSLSLSEEKELLISSFPNPVQDVLNITGSELDNATIRVHDTQMKEVDASITRISDNHVELHMADLSAGVYFLMVELGGQQAVQKIVKE